MASSITIPVYRTFRFKLIVFFIGLVTILQVVTSTLVHRTITRNMAAEIERQLLHTSETFTLQLESRSASMKRETSVLSADHGFRTAVATDDRATIRSALVSLIERMNADRAMVVSLESEIVADIGRPEGHTDEFPFANMVDVVDQGDSAASTLVLNNVIYEFAMAPVLAPLPIAGIGIGFAVDDRLALLMKQQSSFDLDISFGSIDENGAIHLAGSTLGAAGRTDIALADWPNFAPARPTRMELGTERCIALFRPLPTPENSLDAFAILQCSLDRAMAPYRAMLKWLLLFSSLCLAVVLAAGVWIARGVTQPVLSLSQAAGRIRSGDYETPVTVRQADELGHLADGFNHMMAGIRQREQKIYHQTHHDALTGLPNRLSFEEILQETIQKDTNPNTPLGVVLIGLDRIDEINGTLGHRLGDKIVQQIATRLSEGITRVEPVTRIATDMFMLLVPGMNADHAETVSRDVLKCFDAPFRIDDVAADVNAHVGVACYPLHGETVKLLMQHADVALYHARQSPVRYAVYAPDTDSHSTERLSLMGKMRRGLEDGEFQLFYQPKICLKTRRITHAEALIRWEQPDSGFVFPDTFIPLAEQTGNIDRITSFSLATAMQQCSTWHKNGYPIKVAVNLSAKDLLDAKLTDRIGQLLSQHDMQPDWLILEITESAVMQDMQKAMDMLRQLNAMGIILSIDDFGTGYSSVAYLKKLPVHEIKIDKSFVMELSQSREDAVIVRSTIEMGHNLGFRVIAEGVEDEHALRLLSEFGCDLAQGYFFSRPLPVSEFEGWLRDSPWGIAGTPETSAQEKQGE